MPSDTGSSSGRRAAWGVGVAVVALAALDGAAWFWGVRQIEAGVPAAQAAATAYGWSIDPGQASRAGWPFAAAVVYRNVVALRPMGAATLRITIPQVELRFDPLDPKAITTILSGRQTIAIGDAPPWTAQAETTFLRTPFDGGPAHLTVRSLDVMAPDGTTGMTAAILNADIADASLAATASAVQLRPALPAPFQGGAEVSLRGQVRPPFQIAPTPRASAALWQAAGGTLEASDIHVTWGPLDLAGGLSGGLDAELQPQGTGNFTAKGVPDVIQATAAAQVIPPAGAQAAQAVISLLTLSAGGGPLRLPLTVGHGLVSVARFPLLALPRIDW